MVAGARRSASAVEEHASLGSLVCVWAAWQVRCRGRLCGQFRRQVRPRAQVHVAPGRDMTARHDPAMPRVASIGSYELWMLSQAALGFVVYGGIMFLIPLDVLAQGGTPADTGSVVALAGVLGLAGPFFGSIADRFRLYRSAQLLALALLALSAIVFAYAREELTWLLAAGLLGLGTSGTSVINRTFVAGAGFDHRTQARKLALLQLSLPAGQCLGLAAIAVLRAAGMSIAGIFLAIAAACVAFTVAVCVVNGAAARRLVIAAGPVPAVDRPRVARVPLRSVLISQFGLSLLLTFLIMVSAQGIESQYPSYMESVFGVDDERSAGALSVIMLISIPLYLLAGRWTAHSGPRVPFLLSAAVRAVAGAALLALPATAGVAALVVFALLMAVYPLFELNSAVLASANSPFGPGAGQGASGAALALGAVVAAIVAGWLAQQFGFASLAVIPLIAAGAAAVLGVLMLRPTAYPSTEGR